MNFMKAMQVAESVIREQRDGLNEIYLYERCSQKQVYLKNREGSLDFSRDKYLTKQIYLGAFLDKSLQGTNLSLDTIFSISWEVHFKKNQHLNAIPKQNGKTKEEFIDYVPIGKEEVKK